MLKILGIVVAFTGFIIAIIGVFVLMMNGNLGRRIYGYSLITSGILCADLFESIIKNDTNTTILTIFVISLVVALVCRFIYSDQDEFDLEKQPSKNSEKARLLFFGILLVGSFLFDINHNFTLIIGSSFVGTFLRYACDEIF